MPRSSASAVSALRGRAGGQSRTMDDFVRPAVDLLRRAESPDPLDDRRLRRALESRSLARVAPGVFALADGWSALSAMDRHRVRVHESARSRRTEVVFSHFAAAALWGIDVLGPWPDRVDVTVPAHGGGRSSGIVRRRTRDTTSLETVPFGRHRVTTPAQTALDLARSERFAPAVAAVDQALWRNRPEGPLVTRGQLLHRLAADAGRRGDARAARAIDFAEDLAANVRESQSRVVVAGLGFPRPRLQERRVLASGRVVYADLYFPEHDHWCEIDGRAKYRDPVYLAGRTPAQAVIDEKNRENEIRREVRAFSRWEPRDAEHPARIWDILTRAGLPSRLPRP